MGELAPVQVQQQRHYARQNQLCQGGSRPMAAPTLSNRWLKPVMSVASQADVHGQGVQGLPLPTGIGADLASRASIVMT
jgi:hypothetical protein